MLFLNRNLKSRISKNHVFFSFHRKPNPSFSDAFTAALSQYLPAAAAAGATPFGHQTPTPSFLPTPPFMPFAHLPPALETLAGSRALTALAHAQKRLREQTEEDEIQKSAAKKCRVIEDPLDLSSSASEDDVDVLSIDPPPSPSNVEQWSVDKVVEFVSNVESCRDYAQVNIILFERFCLILF